MCCDGRCWGYAHPGLGTGSRAREGVWPPSASGEPCWGSVSPWGSLDMADTGSRSSGWPRRVCEWWHGSARDGTVKGGGFLAGRDCSRGLERHWCLALLGVALGLGKRQQHALHPGTCPLIPGKKFAHKAPSRSSCKGRQCEQKSTGIVPWEGPGQRLPNLKWGTWLTSPSQARAWGHEITLQQANSKAHTAARTGSS